MKNTPTAPRFPARRFYGQMMQTSLAGLFSMRGIQDKTLDDGQYVGRRLMGFKLPEWQRKQCWTDQQSIRFLESIWMGISLGTFMVNYSKSGLDDDTHLVLLDGQQRLRAIERYWNDELAVLGENGEAYYWNELTAGEKAHFDRISFPWVCTEYGTDPELREAYNRHNFGGTAHRADEVA